MNETRQASFEGWAIVELMGHQREVGYVTTEAYGQAVLFRIDTPGLPEREFVLTHPEWTDVGESSRSWTPAGSKVKRAEVAARSRLVAPGSLYAINPCTEEAARTAIESNVSRPLILIEIAVGKQLLPASEALDGDPDEDDGDDQYEDEFEGTEAI